MNAVAQMQHALLTFPMFPYTVCVLLLLLLAIAAAAAAEVAFLFTNLNLFTKYFGR